ncbi:MAG: multiheme c-type cytochrome [Candidatus Brocadiales bacterium]
MIPFPINLSIPWLIAFLVFACGLVATCTIWIFTEWGEPEWKKYQRIELTEMRENLEKQLPVLEDPKWGDPSQAKIVRASIEFLRKPDYQIKQIILKGRGSWKEGTTGIPVDRCMTCHIDEDKLTKQHPYTKDHFAYDIYGCTVCHEGQGRVLTKEGAHEGMLRNKRDMMQRIQKPEEMVALWERMAKLSVEEGDTAFDFRDYSAAGEKLVYMGSFGCLKCHRKLTPRHVEVWADNKFKTWEKVQAAEDYVEGDENYQKKCLKCHTTGYDEKTGEYAEENVTCEACHGPGEMYVKFMSEGKLAEAAVVTYEVFSFKVCGRCHVSRRHEMREAMLLAVEEEEEFSEWLASSFVEESDALHASISEETEAFGLEELKGLEEVANSLDMMLEDLRTLLPEQEETVQTAEEVEPDGEGPPHPLRARLEAPEPFMQEAQAETAKEPFSGKGVY